jgi:metal transporter CNNM
MPVLPGLRRVTPFSRQDYSSFEKLPDGENDKSELVMPSPSMVQTANLFYQPFNADASSMDLRPNPLYRQFDANVSGIDITESFEYSVMPGATREHPREDSGDTISVNSWNYGDPHSIDGLNSRVYSASFVASTVASIRDARAHIPANDQRDSAESPRVVPYNGFPPELLDQAKENQVPHFASRTMPRMMGMMGGFDGSNDQRESETHHRESSFHDDRALLPSQRRALNGSAGMSLGIIRRTSFWF